MTAAMSYRPRFQHRQCPSITGHFMQARMTGNIKVMTILLDPEAYWVDTLGRRRAFTRQVATYPFEMLERIPEVA